MANKKISDMAAADALDGTEKIEVVQSGDSKYATVSQVKTFAGIAATNGGQGCAISNNGTDPNNDLDIAVGAWQDLDDGTWMVLSSALTKRLDANFAAGTNQGGLDTGNKANSTPYSIWLISDGGSTVDVLFSASATSPTMPSGYTKKRRIGLRLTDGSGNLRPTTQTGDYCRLDTALDVKAYGLTGSTSRITISSAGPPGVTGRFAVMMSYAGNNRGMRLGPITDADVAVSKENATIYGYGDSNKMLFDAVISAASTIYGRATNTDDNYQVSLFGWVDTRGKE